MTNAQKTQVLAQLSATDAAQLGASHFDWILSQPNAYTVALECADGCLLTDNLAMECVYTRLAQTIDAVA